MLSFQFAYSEQICHALSIVLFSVTDDCESHDFETELRKEKVRGPFQIFHFVTEITKCTYQLPRTLPGYGLPSLYIEVP